MVYCVQLKPNKQEQEMTFAVCIMSGVLGLGALALLAVLFVGMSLEFAEVIGGVEEDTEEED